MLKIHHGSDWYILHKNGQIERPGLVKPSENWKVTGAVRYNNFGYIVQRYNLFEVLNNHYLKWKYKNGKQRVYILALDHGTEMRWVNPTYEIVEVGDD